MTDIPPQASQFSADPVTATGAGHAINAMVEQAQQVVRMLRAFAATDRVVDLAGLEHLVGVLCAQTLDLPPAEGRLFRASLEGLLVEPTTAVTLAAAQTLIERGVIKPGEPVLLPLTGFGLKEPIPPAD